MVEESNSVRNNIKRIIEQNKVGSLFNANDFKSCGSYTAIRTAIVDLCKEKCLERVCQGVYVKPGTGKEYIPDNDIWHRYGTACSHTDADNEPDR